MAQSEEPTIKKAKIVKSEAPKAFETAEKPKIDRKQRNQIITVGVVLVLIAVILFVTTLQSGTGNENQAETINSEFNVDALEQVENRDRNYPQVPLNNLGKDNPFGEEQ